MSRFLFSSALISMLCGACSGSGDPAVNGKPVTGPDPACYGPSQNLEAAYTAGAVGCACGKADADVCASAPDGRRVALLCSNGTWNAVEDGPCSPSPMPACYSPTQNLEAAYTAGAVGCACGEADADVCASAPDGRQVALMCSDGKWIAAEDGPCEPRHP